MTRCAFRASPLRTYSRMQFVILERIREEKERKKGGRERDCWMLIEECCALLFLLFLPTRCFNKKYVRKNIDILRRDVRRAIIPTRYTFLVLWTFSPILYSSFFRFCRLKNMQYIILRKGPKNSVKISPFRKRNSLNIFHSINFFCLSCLKRLHMTHKNVVF